MGSKSFNAIDDEKRIKIIRNYPVLYRATKIIKIIALKRKFGNKFYTSLVCKINKSH